MEQAAQPSVPVSVTNQSARLSMLLGIVSIFGGVFITSIPAIVFGHVALRQIRTSKGRQHGKGMASAGLILGYIITMTSLILIAWIGYDLWWWTFRSGI